MNPKIVEEKIREIETKLRPARERVEFLEQELTRVRLKYDEHLTELKKKEVHARWRKAEHLAKSRVSEGAKLRELLDEFVQESVKVYATAPITDCPLTESPFSAEKTLESFLASNFRFRLEEGVRWVRQQRLQSSEVVTNDTNDTDDTNA